MRRHDGAPRRERRHGRRWAGGPAGGVPSTAVRDRFEQSSRGLVGSGRQARAMNPEVRRTPVRRKHARASGSTPERHPAPSPRDGLFFFSRHAGRHGVWGPGTRAKRGGPCRRKARNRLAVRCVFFFSGWHPPMLQMIRRRRCPARRRRAGTWANARWARAIYDICAATPSMTQSRSSGRCSSRTTGSAPASDAWTLDVPPDMNYGTACGIVVRLGTNSTTAAGRPEGRFARERHRMPHGDAEHRHGMRSGKGRLARAPCAHGEHDVARRDAGTPSRDATPTRGPHRMPRRIAGRRDATRRLCASPSEPIRNRGDCVAMGPSATDAGSGREGSDSVAMSERDVVPLRGIRCCEVARKGAASKGLSGRLQQVAATCCRIATVSPRHIRAHLYS